MQELQNRLATSYPIYRKIWQALKEEEPYPFSSEAYHAFLGYQTQEASEEAIRNHPDSLFEERTLITDAAQITALYLEKGFFLELARKRKNADPWIRDLHLWYKADCLRHQVLHFSDNAKKRKLRWLGLKAKERGPFHTYSLDTITLAESLQLDPQTVFNLLNEKGLLSFAPKIGFRKKPLWLESERENGNIFLPYASFNSLDPQVRKRFMLLLECLYDEAKLDEEQLQLMETLAEAVAEMLSQQAICDEAQILASQQEREAQDQQKIVSLRLHYKQAARLCHPDIFESTEKKAIAHNLFLELSTAYEEEKLKKVRQIHLRAIHALGSKDDLKEYRALEKV